MVYILLGLLIFCAHLFSAWFSRRRIPDVLLLMIIGIVIGPVTGWVSPADLSSVGPVFASLTLLFILFDSGLDMRLDTIRNYWTGVVQVTFLSFITAMATVAILGYYYIGFELMPSIMLGAMVGGTAAAIVIPLVAQMRVSQRTSVTLTLESAISGVLCIVTTLSFIHAFKEDGNGNPSIGILIGRVVGAIIISLLLGVSGGIVWSSFMHRIRKLQNSMFLTPAFIFVIYGVTEAFGYSGALAALAFGLVMGNPDYFSPSFLSRFKLQPMTHLQENEKSFFKEFVFILKTYFFVYIGICIPFTNTTVLLYGLVISAALFVVRFILIAIVGRKNTPDDRLTVSMMIPKGLVSAVLASLPEQINIDAGETVIPGATTIKYVTYAVIFCSICICSILVLITSKRLIKNDNENQNENENALL